MGMWLRDLFKVFLLFPSIFSRPQLKYFVFQRRGALKKIDGESAAE